MKKAFLGIALVLAVGFTACGNKKTGQDAAAEAIDSVQQVDSTALKDFAGDYQSYDGTKVISLKADGTATTKNIPGAYTGWEVSMRDSSIAAINLVRQGLDAPIKEQAQLDVKEKALIVKSETFRIAKK